MICNHCGANLGYGYKYCTVCGGTISKSAIEEAYNDTVWGQFDSLIAKYEECTLKKITGNYFFRICLILFCAVLIYFGLYGENYQLHILKSEMYRIQYDTKTNEYYVLSEEDIFNLEIHIPKFADNVRFTCYIGGEEQSEDMKPEECRIQVIKDKCDYMTVEAMQGKKILQSLKFSAP